MLFTSEGRLVSEHNKPIRSVGIFPNFGKNNAITSTLAVCDRLLRMDVEVWADFSCAEVLVGRQVRYGDITKIGKNVGAIITIGGDGTILACAQLVGQTPILGVNSGRLGFMATVETGELGLLERLADGNYQIQRRMLLEVVERDGKKRQFTALNDVVFSRTVSRLADFSIWTGGKCLTEIRADGLVLSTPTGSTAYALSAGGPVIEHSMDCIELTPVCPHSLFSRAIIFDPTREIEILCEGDRGGVVFSIDGQSPCAFESGSRVIVRRSQKYVQLINLKGNTFYDAVRNKLT